MPTKLQHYPFMLLDALDLVFLPCHWQQFDLLQHKIWGSKNSVQTGQPSRGTLFQGSVFVQAYTRLSGLYRFGARGLGKLLGKKPNLLIWGHPTACVVEKIIRSCATSPDWIGIRETCVIPWFVEPEAEIVRNHFLKQWMDGID